MPQKKKKEVLIELSPFSRIEEPKIIENTIEKERKNVFKITLRIGQSISGLMITVGTLLFIFSLQYILSPFLDIPGFPTFKSLLTPEFIMVLVGFLGFINIICGFVLLTKK
jgi:hypothetical protein